MLLSFKTSNFKAFQHEVCLNMVPAKVDEFSYSVLKKEYRGKMGQALCSSVIYGPNAAGKSTIVHAMSCLKNIILRGDINDDVNECDDIVSNHMSLIPFLGNDATVPTMFEIEFIFESHKYLYRVAAEFGAFAEPNYRRRIVEERLDVDDYLVFLRTPDDIAVSHLTKIKDLLLEGFKLPLANRNLEISKSNLSPRTLFLTSDFDSIISKKIPSGIKKWLRDDFIVINRSGLKNLRPLLVADENIHLVEGSLNLLARESGIIGSDFGYHKTKEGKTELLSIVSQGQGRAITLPSELIESQGTLRLITMAPYLFDVIEQGGTLIVDEFDTSLHPMIIMNILNIFHNDEVNQNKAQLVFNTHNPIYLDNQLLRRDEIKFVEKDKKTKASILYALSDFKTSGPSGVRNTTDYMKNYFVNRFGAIENIDLSDLFLTVASKGGSDA